MKVTKDTFFSVGTELNIPQEKVEAFWKGLEKETSAAESSPFAKWLFYLGTLVVIAAMTWFMDLGWDHYGGGGVFLIATAYALIFTFLGAWLGNKKNLRIPSGLLITVAVSMVPLAIYGLETYFDIWEKRFPPGLYTQFYLKTDGQWIYMELGTIIAGIVALRFFPFPFITCPIFFAAWLLTMDIVPFLFGHGLAWEEKSWLSLCFGLVLIFVGFVIDRSRRDYAFWSYLFGALSFWIGLNNLVWGKGELLLFGYLMINVLMMCLSILVRRHVLMVFGAIGVFIYLSHLAYNIFKDSILFPFVLSAIGLGIICMGILYQRNLAWIEKNIFEKLPASIRSFLNHI